MGVDYGFFRKLTPEQVVRGEDEEAAEDDADSKHLLPMLFGRNSRDR
jgi:hypothetical protein